MEAELHALRSMVKELETASAEAEKKLAMATADERAAREARAAAALAAKGLAEAEEQACPATCSHDAATLALPKNSQSHACVF